MKIAIDLDGTIFSTYERMAELYFLETGKVMDLSCVSNWDKKSPVFRWIQRYFKKPEAYLNIAPYPDAIKVLEDFSKRHELYFVTVRKKEIKEDTLRIMKSYGFDKRIYFVERAYKVELYQLLKVELVLEDELDYALVLVKNHIKVILFHRPWNHQKHYDYLYGFRRVHDWKEVNQAGKELFEGV